MTPTPVPPYPGGELVTFAEHQPEYEPLPAFRGHDGTVITRWRLTWRERLLILVGRPLWLYVSTHGQRLQPILPTLAEPVIEP